MTVGPMLQIRRVAADLTILETHPITPGLRLSASQMESITETETTNSPANKMTRILTISSEVMGSYPTLIIDRETPTVFGGTNGGIVFEIQYPTNNTPSRTSSRHKKEEKGIGSLNRGTGIAVIVIVTVIVGIILWTTSFLAIRRHRRAKGRQNAHVADGDCYSSGGEQKFFKDENSGSSMATLTGSSASEGEGKRADIGTVPNPAELEGDAVPPHWSWLSRRSRLRSSPANQSQDSHHSFYSTRSSRRIIRESFGEKVNDPAAILGRLRIHNTLSTAAIASSTSSSPRSGSFLRLPRSPQNPQSPAAGMGVGAGSHVARPSSYFRQSDVSPRPLTSADKGSKSGRQTQDMDSMQRHERTKTVLASGNSKETRSLNGRNNGCIRKG